MRTHALLALLLTSAACGDGVIPPEARAPYEGAPLAPLDCVPNLDGRIDADELAPAFGIGATYLVSPAGETRGVELFGTVDVDGLRSWDLTASPDDAVVTIAAAELSGRWYAASFPGGAFVTPFDAGGRVEAVYHHDQDGLWLHGLASALEDPAEGRTLLVYGEPIALFRFPIEPGAEWISTGEIRNGLIRGLPYAGRDIYAAEVFGAGTLALPDLSFAQAHAVRFQVTAQPAVGQSVSRRQTSFLFECFGEVARATSRDGETEDAFTTAAELRRLGF